MTQKNTRDVSGDSGMRLNQHKIGVQINFKVRHYCSILNI